MSLVHTTVEAVLAQFADKERPEAVVLAIRQLTSRAANDLLIASELAYEAHERGYWSLVTRPDGRPYENEETFFEDVLGVPSWRSAYRRIAMGRALDSLPPEERESVGATLVELGIAKAAVLAPVLTQTEDPAQRTRWLEIAKQVPCEDLQKHVTESLGGGARPREASPSVAKPRIDGYLTNQMPTLEDRQVCERFFALGRRLGKGNTPMGILTAGLMECVGQWESEAGRH